MTFATHDFLALAVLGIILIIVRTICVTIAEIVLVTWRFGLQQANAYLARRRLAEALNRASDAFSYTVLLSTGIGTLCAVAFEGIEKLRRLERRQNENAR